MSRRCSIAAPKGSASSAPNSSSSAAATCRTRTERLSRAIGLAHRQHKQVGLLFLDLDDFKHVNDSLGHAIGDQLLQSVGERLSAIVRTTDTVCRQGGDEFVILLNPASTQQIVELGSSLREQIQQLAAQTFATPQSVTLSIGANLFDQPPSSLAVLIEQGDTTLYESKRGGRDSIRLVDRTGGSSG